MTSTIKVNKHQNACGTNIIQRCGTTTTIGSGASNTLVMDGSTVTIGRCGGTVALASGATQSGFGRTGTVNWDTTPKTSTVTAASGVGYFVDTTSGSVTVNLPAGSAGAIVAVADYANTADTNKITISPNGSNKIQGIARDFEITVEGGSVTLVYVDSTQGWRPTDASTAAAITENAVFITATGGTITTSGDFKIHTFTGPGTFCVSAGSGPVAKVDYVVVAGGGGAGGSTNPGGGGAGGGAGGYRESHCATTSGPYTASPLASPTSLPISPGAIPVTVGGGGSGKGPGNYVNGFGSNSIFSTITSTGGGDGGMNNSPGQVRPSSTTLSDGSTSTSTYNGGQGGSGGGGGFFNMLGGQGNTPSVSPSQGNNGGQGKAAPQYSGAGGGGAGAVGSDASPGAGGNGGAGVTSSITSSPVARAGGGGGASSNGTDGSGGSGGGGAGTSPGGTGGAGSANTGGGGGAGGSPGNATGGAGGSGIVIIRYKFQ
jgi:hypothetical protein